MTTVRLRKIELKNFKALVNFSLSVSEMNVLVGPNNCGKSTVLGACRALSGALRRARRRKAEPIHGAGPHNEGWRVDEKLLPITVENIHSDYREESTEARFSFSNNGQLHLNFPADGGCVLWATTPTARVNTPTLFKRHFPIEVRHVPVLGPVNNAEDLVKKETVQRALGTHRASRYFRSYWYHFPNDFDRFARLVRTTWQGMAIGKPELAKYGLQELAMFCEENRISRELFWAGFGFQVWCQLLTHIASSTGSTLLVLDEPETYLHPDLQRRLLLLLREADPDIIFATHSTELMSEADPSDIVVVNKSARWGRRLKNINDVQQALESVGSVQNITLTELSRHRRVVFVEGDTDYGIFRRFAKRLDMSELAASTGLASVEVEAFDNWKRVQGAAWAIERALGSNLAMAVVLDRDYRCDEEIADIERNLGKHVPCVHIHRCKEVENYLLVPQAIQRALEDIARERAQRSGGPPFNVPSIESLLSQITQDVRAEAQAQYIAKRTAYLSARKEDPATVTKTTIEAFEEAWRDLRTRLRIVPGKKVLASLRTSIQDEHGISFSNSKVIAAMRMDEIPEDMRALLDKLECFRTSAVALEP